jgi:integrase
MEMGSETQTIPTARPRRKSRRGQRGSIIRRGDGWTVVFRTAEGKQKWQGGFRTKEDAQDALGVTLKAVRDNRYVETKHIEFLAFCDDWMARSKSKLKPKTWLSYKSALKIHILPRFGDWQLNEISRAAVKSFFDDLLGRVDLSRKFVRNVLVLLHRIFEEAIDAEAIATNPAHRIKLPNPDSEHVDQGDLNLPGVPKPDQVVRVFAKLPPVYQVLVWAGAVTGLRRGELLGLFWNDIDFLRCTVQVRRSLQRISKALLSEGQFRGVERIENTGLALLGLKSKRARRTVEMPARLARLLVELRQKQIAGDSKFVFQDELGRPLDPDFVYSVLHTAQDAAEVERFGLHGLRHLYCSLLVNSGAQVKDAQQRLGHASAMTTLDIYAHAISEDGRKFSDAVEGAFSSVSNLLAEGNSEPTTVEMLN